MVCEPSGSLIAYVLFVSEFLGAHQPPYSALVRGGWVFGILQTWPVGNVTGGDLAPDRLRLGPFGAAGKRGSPDLACPARRSCAVLNCGSRVTRHCGCRGRHWILGSMRASPGPGQLP
jgi:hypothetical protein